MPTHNTYWGRGTLRRLECGLEPPRRGVVGSLEKPWWKRIVFTWASIGVKVSPAMAKVYESAAVGATFKTEYKKRRATRLASGAR